MSQNLDSEQDEDYPAGFRQMAQGREFMVRLENGGDWREQIENFADENQINAAWFNAMGAVQDAEIWYYHQDEKEYEPIEFDEHLEVAACVGNISILDDERFAHTHAVLSRDDGETIAGHLNAATVFAGEVYVREFEDSLVRKYEETTELDLWL